MVAMRRETWAVSEIGSGGHLSSFLLGSCSRSEICRLGRKLGLEAGS
jgi:hypothetical protein